MGPLPARMPHWRIELASLKSAGLRDPEARARHVRLFNN